MTSSKDRPRNGGGRTRNEQLILMLQAEAAVRVEKTIKFLQEEFGCSY